VTNLYFERDCNLERIRALLEIANQYFNPPISERVNLDHYSEKLANNAINIFCIDKNKDIGHAAVYANNYKENRAFLTSLFVDPVYYRHGIATKLLSELTTDCKKSQMSEIQLNVKKTNKKAISLYSKSGFLIAEVFDDELRMTKSLI